MTTERRRELISKHATQQAIQPATDDTVNEYNAHAYSDNYTIYGEVQGAVGCEHNESEAKALRDWMTNYHGINFYVRRNHRHQVDAAKAWFPKPLLSQMRETAFRETGLWPRKATR